MRRCRGRSSAMDSTVQSYAVCDVERAGDRGFLGDVFRCVHEVGVELAFGVFLVGRHVNLVVLATVAFVHVTDLEFHHNKYLQATLPPLGIGVKHFRKGALWVTWRSGELRDILRAKENQRWQKTEFNIRKRARRA